MFRVPLFHLKRVPRLSGIEGHAAQEEKKVEATGAIPISTLRPGSNHQNAEERVEENEEEGGSSNSARAKEEQKVVFSAAKMKRRRKVAKQEFAATSFEAGLSGDAVRRLEPTFAFESFSSYLEPVEKEGQIFFVAEVLLRPWSRSKRPRYAYTEVLV